MNALSKLLLPVLLLAAGAVAAQDATVMQVHGTLSVKRADGSVRILSQRSQVASGDTLSTAAGSYALIRFRDGAQVLLKPGTAVKIDGYSFSDDKPQEDLFTYSLLHGGLRASAGTIGRRSSAKYTLATASGGVRGQTFAVEDCVTGGGEQCATRERAIYVQVMDGNAAVGNAQGEIGLSAGQTGLITPDQRPLFLSADPGLQFTPPPTFIRSVMAGSIVNTGRNLECAITR
ncbi:MAG TPA: FecR domain-containing protein [Burkholderiales bacterium]